ncbi:MAG: acetate--CoA ligase [Acidimicrobiales bacterium]
MDTYGHLCANFDWNQAQLELSGLPGGGLNIAHEALDRHVTDGNGDRVAIRWLAKSGEQLDLTYGDMVAQTNRFANVLDDLGSDGVATLMGRVPSLYVAALGTLKAGAVYTPLFAAFGPDPIKMRLDIGRIDTLVTTAQHYRRKIKGIRSELPALRHVLIAGPGAEDFNDATVMDLDELLGSADPDYTVAQTQPEDRALLHFTSGTTGKPKGAIHVHNAVVGHSVTGRLVLTMNPGDVFWCTADPGWVTGTSYGIISPLVNGVTSIVDEAEFDAERWYRILQEQKVNIFYTAPTALRMLQKIGTEVRSGFDFTELRVVASVGEPLDPESVVWAGNVFGVPVLDNWWQTETGAIMIANLVGEPVKPGSMGRPLPGVTATLLATDPDGELVRDADGMPREVTATDEVGELALLANWPSMFRGYLNQQRRYEECFAGPWYHSGDLARRDADGYYWFVGRNNDVIKSAGHLIGPFEVESALTEHPAVIEAGVIGKPDPTAGSIVKAFVVLASGIEGDDGLRKSLIAHSRKRLGPAVAPREIDFAESLPHTRSGKIMRRVLKAQELGTDVGDLSTLEVPA